MKRKISQLDENPKVSEEILNRVTEILYHRSGTPYEDLAYIDTINEKSLINKDFDYFDGKKSACKPSEEMNVMLEKSTKGTIIGLHNHPRSKMVSMADLYKAYERKYKYGLVVCHNGNIFKYSVTKDSYINEATEYTIENRLGIFEKLFYNNDRSLEEEIKMDGILRTLREDYGITIEAIQ